VSNSRNVAENRSSGGRCDNPLYPLTVVLIAGAAELGAWLRQRSPILADEAPVGTLVGDALGLRVLLLAFSFSLAL
jgi:hypothetical protein